MLSITAKNLGKLFLPTASLFYCFQISHAQQPQLVNQRQLTLLEEARRPGDPWPRSDGHVLLGEPGSPLAQKAYFEPGGSFSPGAGTFGISIWVIDKDSSLVATSDNIPMNKIRQRYLFHDSASIPAIETSTPYYKAVWSALSPGDWKLDLSRPKGSAGQIVLVTRSVGPAGGPLYSVIWDSTRLLLNTRWILTTSVNPAAVFTGDEEAGELRKSLPNKTSARSSNGWAYGKLFLRDSNISVRVSDTKPQFASMLSYHKTVPAFEINLPDSQFKESLQAQVANLMMGYIGRQTGPGEPINYPLAWERDGAYSLMAMAKSGQLETARQLSVYFAENDFFGGFGAEGDAPGSAINALSELAFLLNDPGYYQWVWPHIKRKLTYIDKMMTATDDVYENYIGPLVPHLESNVRRRQLICRKSEDGLIIGTMDGHFPVLYINAISYRGLVQASRLARHFKEPDLAKACLEKAASLKAAWTKGFGQPKYDNERNFMISVWPSWITNKTNQLFNQKIKEKHDQEWGDSAEPKDRPLWTYFTTAEAHQWLFLDQPEQTWKTLRYFWNNQCSPGLYSYWEGNGEENSFRQWENYRGWLHPKYITPHYWTASEQTLLHIDMLNYIDESGDEFEFVVGAGVPQQWLKETMSVRNYRTKAGTISWEYKNNVLNVTVRGAEKRYRVRPGINFIRAKTKVNISYK